MQTYREYMSLSFQRNDYAVIATFVTSDDDLVKLLRALEGEARWARQEGHAKGERSPNYLDFIYSGPLRRVLPAAVTIDE